MEISTITTSTGLEECHIMIHSKSLSALQHECAKIVSEKQLSGQRQVFGRLFLKKWEDVSDIISGLNSISVINQPPLDGSEAILWLYFISNEKSDQYQHLWSVSLTSSHKDVKEQTIEILHNYMEMLGKKGLTLKDNCIRTWFFISDIDHNYGQFIEGRKEIFNECGLTQDSHYIASTGIQGSGNNIVTMDAYSISGIDPSQITYLKGESHLSPTALYGVTFERGTSVQYEDRKHIFISGTASIDQNGQVLHIGNACAQTERTMENINILLTEAEASFENIAMAIVYLRNENDYQTVRKVAQKYLNAIPTAYLLAPVCRPDWLVEIECLAICAR